MQPHRATLILVMGILGLVLCPICAPIAWVMGNRDIQAMNSGLMDPTGLEQTKAGKICGIIGTILLVLVAIALVFFFVILGFAASQGNFQ
ncbi:MAG: hypothetical protein JNJ70_23065 [Verrucomicrobiales bacterium]|nr:hypothetical protein [Verrucomicrobiales bacterium]